MRRLFVLAYVIDAHAVNNEADIKNNKKYFLPRGGIKSFKVLIDGRNFYDKPINDLIKQYEVRKISTGQGDDYTTGCLLVLYAYLLNYAYFKDNYRLIDVDLSKQNALDSDPRATQQIVFIGIVGGANNSKIRLYTILEILKETVLEFYKGTSKVL